MTWLYINKVIFLIYECGKNDPTRPKLHLEITIDQSSAGKSAVK